MPQRTVNVGIMINSILYDIGFFTDTEFYVSLKETEKTFSSDGQDVKFHFLQIGSADDQQSQAILSRLSEMEILAVSPKAVAPFMKVLPKSVKWVHSFWSGSEPIYQAVGRQAGLGGLAYVVTQTKECRGPSMAEYVIGAIISLERKFKRLLEGQATKEWLSIERTTECCRFRSLDALTVGVLGAGDIGMVIASNLKKLGMTVYAVKRTPLTDEQKRVVDKCFTLSELDTFLSSCDYICNVLPSTPFTKSLLSGERLKICSTKKPGFINVGRGDIIDEQSLINALNQGWISSAFLDVFETEPLPLTSQLWNMEKVTITPHISSRRVPTSILKAFTSNLQRYLNGEKLMHAFDWENGY